MDHKQPRLEPAAGQGPSPQEANGHEVMQEPGVWRRGCNGPGQARGAVEELSAVSSRHSRQDLKMARAE